MTSLANESQNLYDNPLDQIEHLFHNRSLSFDRPADDELVLDYSGVWCHYHMWFRWQPEMQALMFVCAYDIKIAANTRTRLYPLLSQINEKLWLGHFDLDLDEGEVFFRHTLLLHGAQALSSEPAEALMETAIVECERFYPAFQAVIWGRKSAEEALAGAIFDTVGEA